MKYMRNYWNKSWGWLLSSLLTMLGFSACNRILDKPQPDMYGTPTATFSIKGKVVNAAGQALPGVRVVVPYSEFYQVATENFIPDYPIITREIRDTTYSNEDGSFERTFYDLPTDTIRFEMQFYDINPLPGVLPCEPDTLKVTFLRGDLKKDKHAGTWDRGHAEKEITVILKEKKDEE